jgi:hypothetical protein
MALDSEQHPAWATSVQDVKGQQPMKSTYKVVIANPYLFGVALVCFSAFLDFL